MHGGARLGGAEGRAKRELSHGFYTAEAIPERRAIRALIRKLEA
jgi:hypothetical protein